MGTLFCSACVNCGLADMQDSPRKHPHHRQEANADKIYDTAESLAKLKYPSAVFAQQLRLGPTRVEGTT